MVRVVRQRRPLVERSTQISTVLLLSTGGTISSRRSERGGLVATDGARELFAGLAGVTDASGAAIEIRALDVMRIGSYLLRPNDMLEIARRIDRELAADDVLGVVVTHGTDTMEETAFLADLVHVRSAPVVFTGAQRSADAPDSDGPRNVADAVAVAASGSAADLGVLIVFDGLVFAASGTRKSQTLASAAFASTGSGPIGRVHEGEVVIHSAPIRFDPIPVESLNVAAVQVDIVPFYPGASTTALRAVAADGANGIVLEATGAGNANPDFCREVAKLTASGVVVALSTRVASGPVTAIYGAGGGIDLVKAGAVPVGTLRSPQARMLLIALLAASRDPESVRRELRRRCGGAVGVG